MSQWDKIKNMSEFITYSQSPFSEFLIAERTPIIQINGSHAISELRDILITEGTSTISSVDSEYQLTNTSSGDKAIMLTASRGRYTPGNASEAGVGIRFPDEITGDAVAYWGYFDTDSNGEMNNGAVFGKDSQGVFIEIFKQGISQTKVYQNEWNISSEINLDEGNVFQVRFTYYGYGLIEFRALKSKTGDLGQDVITLHTYRPEGEPVLANSNLRVGAMIKNNTDTNEYNLFLSGRQFSTVGKANFKQRSVTHIVEDVSVGSTDFIPLMTFRKKTGRESVSISVQGEELITDNDIIVKWIINGDLTGTPSWITPDGHLAKEVSLEVDESATGISNGIVVSHNFAIGGQGNQINHSDNVNVTDIPDEYSVSLVAKAVGTGATVTAIGKIIEER